MIVDPLTPTISPPPYTTQKLVRGGTGALIPRVGEAQNVASDREQSFQQQMAQNRAGGAASQAAIASRVHEIVTRLLGLGPQVRRLIKRDLPGKQQPVDEKA